MYYLNKIIGVMTNPTVMGLVVLAALVALRAKRRSLWIVLGLLWFWTSAIPGRILGLPLEREWLVDGEIPTAESFPTADAIVCLGGGMTVTTNGFLSADINQSADRVWMAARLYKAGKAPKVFVTSEADARFMVDLGVPREAITVNDTARNTEEEARGLVEVLGQSRTAAKPKVLLVTSAWHMRRAKLMYERYAKGVEVVPAPTDHMTMSMFGRPLEFRDFIPDPTMIGQNAYLFKEILAYYGYRLLRK